MTASDTTTKPDVSALSGLYAPALDAMKTTGPTPLGARVRFEAEQRQSPELADPRVLADYIRDSAVGDRLLTRLRITLATWDADLLGTWTNGTAPRTPERLQRI